jgi:hypothetical protein
VQFGSVAALGVSLASSSLLAAAALLVLLPVQARSRSTRRPGRRAGASRPSARRPAHLAERTPFGIAGAAGLPKLRVELSVSELWGPDHPLMRAFDFVSAHLQRPTRVELEIALPPGAQIETPGVLRELVEAEAALAGVDGIRSTRSVATVLLHADRLLLGGGPAGGPSAWAS